MKKGNMVLHLKYPTKREAEHAAGGLKAADYRTSIRKEGSMWAVYTNDPVGYLGEYIPKRDLVP